MVIFCPICEDKVMIMASLLVWFCVHFVAMDLQFSNYIWELR